MIPTRMNPMGWQPYRCRLNYLESTGTQYIDTGYLFDAVNKASALEIKLLIPSGTDNSNITFGARKDTYARDSLYLIGWNLVSGNAEDSYTGSAGLPADQSGVFRFAAGKYSVDGGTEVDTGRLPAIPYSFVLFGFKVTASYIVPNFLAKSGTRIYYCKFYEAGTLVRDLFPVLDKSGVPCMYDKCTKTFFYNAGSGNFNYA